MFKTLIKKTNKFKFYFGLFLIICLSFFAIKPFFVSGFFPVHDNTQVQRVFEMSQSLGDGMIPVRWTNDLGYGFGYPIFNYYSPLPYYFAGTLVLLGLNALLATKIMFAVGVVASGIFMYIFAKEMLGKVGGFISAIFYLYAPYFAINIFIRGDIGEVWSYALCPLVGYSIYKIYKTKKLLFAGVFVISYASIIVSHNLSAFMITPFVTAAILFILIPSTKKNKFRVFKLTLIGFFLGLLLSAFYFIPALSELKYTNVASIIGGGSDFRDHFVCPAQFWSSAWGFGGSNPGCVDGISFKLGKIQIIATLLSIGLFFFSFKKLNKESKSLYLIFTVGLLISIFLTLAISKPLWELVDPMKYIQFPWRFIAFINFFSSILIGFSIIFLKAYLSKKQTVLFLGSAVLVMGLLWSSVKLFAPQKYNNFSSNYYTDLSNIKWTTSKISDEYMPADFIKPNNQNQIPSTLLEGKDLRFVDINNSTQVKEVVAYFPREKMYILNVAYFPSWQAFVNYSKTEITNVDGRIGVSVPKGYQLLRLQFIQTPIEKSSNLFTVIGILATLAVIILGIKQKNEKIT